MKVKNVIISQPQPPNYEKSPYYDLAKKYNLNIIFKKFICIEPVSAQEFRREKINILDHTAIIFTCNNAVDHFFRLAKEMRLTIPDTTKYFCVSEKTAFYLQKYVQFRKRKIFNGKEKPEELMTIIKKHLQEKFLLPCTEGHKQEIVNLLQTNKIPVRKAMIYRTIPNLEVKQDVNISKTDMLVFFSPFGIKALFENFPDFKQNKMVIATWGNTTFTAAMEAGLNISVFGPSQSFTSMPMAIDAFLEKVKK
ncbi:MAG TPA: uroporphyrinogen-III synthase [Bacteroidales bacterium]|nr:uroporphyrinogen-III synthase [Bacteroidales bacterium]HPS26408.1 uroporphyrinogen-III synthase [Bacteroidales bacterium]